MARHKKSARERGYLPVDEGCAQLRALANQLEQSNRGRLMKVSLNIWYEDSEPVSSPIAEQLAPEQTTSAGGN